MGLEGIGYFIYGVWILAILVPINILLGLIISLFIQPFRTFKYGFIVLIILTIIAISFSLKNSMGGNIIGLTIFWLVPLTILTLSLALGIFIRIIIRKIFGKS